MSSGDQPTTPANSVDNNNTSLPPQPSPPPQSVTDVLNRPADEFVNDPTIEGLWLTKAVQHMEVYFKLITSVPTARTLRLTPQDDQIYSDFRQQFPDLDVKQLTEDRLKCDEAKAKWRQYCNGLESVVDDFNYATLMRLDARSDYSEANTIVVPRVQFLAIEVARNREGANDGLDQQFSKQ
ncbi:protein PBDC1-like [Oppia nitens]|uniref:protein PBDC1-like n=1 Tax=Oppia nitens TaxID=1686743 RepID=UPI0023DC4BC2|nr:protein PBDC1-like [Oppia nitens]